MKPPGVSGKKNIKVANFIEIQTMYSFYMYVTPMIASKTPADKAQHDKVVALGDNRLELQKKKHETRMERDKELYERQIRIVDAQIDKQVYDLYGLTEVVVNVVEKR